MTSSAIYTLSRPTLNIYIETICIVTLENELFDGPEIEWQLKDENYITFQTLLDPRLAPFGLGIQAHTQKRP